jgi:hypothetical protein
MLGFEEECVGLPLWMAMEGGASRGPALGVTGTVLESLMVWDIEDWILSE